MIYRPRYVDAVCHARLTPYGASFIPRMHRKSFPTTTVGRFVQRIQRALGIDNEIGMAGSFADYAENKVLDHVFGGVTWAPLATHYVLASTSTINDDGTGATEPVAMAYARVAVTNNATNWPAAAAGAKTNGADFVWSEATGNWTDIDYLALMDASTSGNMICYGDVNAGTPLAVGSGDTLRVKAGDFDLALG